MSIPCGQCGAPVEESRECYFHPTCHACLPPPRPLGVIYGRPIGPVIVKRSGHWEEFGCLACHELGHEHVEAEFIVYQEKAFGREYRYACAEHVDAVASKMAVEGEG